MTKLVLKKVRWKNFLSTGNDWTEVDLDASKTCLVVGTNGSGKSTMLDAISFGLFNKPFRNINKTQLPNTITNKDCVVEIEFVINSHQFKVIRGIKPTIFEIYKNGEIVSQEADNKDYQDAFEKYILRTNWKSFCQIFVLGSAIFTPFMALSKGQRREIIEDLLDMRIFTAMNNLLKTKIQETEYETYQADNQKKIINEKLKLTYEHIKEIQESTEKAIVEKEERINSAQSNIEGLNGQRSDLVDKLTTLERSKLGEDKVKKTAKEFSKINHQLQLKVDQIKKEVQFLTDNETCPTCAQVIEPKFKKETIHGKLTHLSELEVGLSKLEEQYGIVRKKVTDFLTLQIEIDENRRLFDNVEINIRNLESYIKEISEDIVRSRATASTDIQRPIELEGELEVVSKKLEELNETRTLQGYAAVMLKDTGIKARIIKTYIPIINQLIAKYCSILDFFVDFQLNEEFTETIKSRFRDVFTYESFSEGEKMRLNLAILFTWRAIAKMRNSVDCNILVFDEILDSSLDAEGVDNMIKLLQAAAPETRVFIISHRDAILDKFERVIQFEKKANFSKVIEA